MEENADDLPAEARDTEEERSSPKADTTAIQEDKQIPVESLEQTSQEVEARDEVQPHVELANVPLNGSKDDEQTDKDVSIAKNEPESAQKEKAVNDTDRLSPTMEDGQLSPSSLQAKYDLLSKAGIVLEGGSGGAAEDDLGKYSEALMTSETDNEEEGKEEEEEDDIEKEKGATGTLKRVRFADQVSEESPTEVADKSEVVSLQNDKQLQQEQLIEKEEEAASATANSPSSPLVASRLPQIPTEQLINGVSYEANYLGSTPIIFSSTQKTVRLQQAKEAVKLIKDPDGGSQPRNEVVLKISTTELVIKSKSLEIDLMVHPLKSVSYVADVDNMLVVMAHRNPPPSPGSQLKLTCHILECDDPRVVAVVIGQAFSTAYKEFLKSRGVTEESMEAEEYNYVLHSQVKSELEVNMLKDETKIKEISVSKLKGEALGVMLIDSGYGSAIPACVVAYISKLGAVHKSGLLNVGDQLLSVNGTSLVGMPLKYCIEQIKKCRSLATVKMTVCGCPAVIDVSIMRPDLKFQLGFSVKDGTVISIWRGSIAERSGVRIGHRIIELNGTSTVGMAHEELVHMLSTTVGDLHMRTMPLLMYNLLTGQMEPECF